MTDPKGTEDRLHRISELFEKGDGDQARAMLAKITLEDPAMRQPALKLGRALAKAGHQAEAAELAGTLIAAHPNFQAAQKLLVEASLANGDFDRAITEARTGLERSPGAWHFALRGADALRNLHRDAEALDLLEQSYDPKAVTAPYFAALAAGYRKADQPDRAALVLDQGLAAFPEDHRILIAWINDGRRQSPDEMLRRADTACRRVPAEPRVMSRFVDVCLAVGAFDKAIAVLTPIVAADPENPKAEASLARALVGAGQRDAAAGVLDAAIVAGRGLPDNWLTRIDLAIAMGAKDVALRAAADAFAHSPDDHKVVVKRCTVLERFADAAPAEAALTAARAQNPTDLVLANSMSQVLIRQGRHSEAVALWDGVLDADPTSSQAWRNLVGVARRCGTLAALRPRFHALFGEADDGLSAQLQVDFLEILVAAGATVEACQVADALPLAQTDLSSADLVRICRAADALERPGIVARVVDVTARRDEVSASLAMVLARHALQSGVPGLAADVLENLYPKLSAKDLRGFRLEAARLSLAPLQAIEQLRQAPIRDLTAQECRSLATLLQQAGKQRLAVRLARMAYHRWPNDRALLEAVVTLSYKSGHADGALAFLDHVDATHPGVDTGGLRALMLLESGRLREGLELIANLEAAGLPSVRLERHFRAAIAAGAFDTATALAVRMRDQPGQRARSAGHFRLSGVGSEFEELQLFDRATGGQAAAEVPADMLPNFVPAARPVLYAACEASPQGAVTDPVDVPRRIFQYWNTTTIAPEMLALIETWKGHAGYDHQVFHRRDAQEYLREHFGLRYVRAFANANQVVQESDFFRLCSLVKDGGIYADTDDQLVSDPDILRGAAARGLAVFLEPFGAIANNIMVAAPGHPALERAAEMACVALLRRDNDLSWAKTGPGLMSRAVASYIHDSGQRELRKDLTLLPEAWVRQHVNIHVPLPYKAQPGYWKSNDQGPTRPLVDALRAFAGVEAA